MLLDLHFGAGEAGWQLLERLKEHDETRALPVVICTASVAAVAGQEERLNHSGVRVMHKPFDLDRLDGELRAAIESQAA